MQSYNKKPESTKAVERSTTNWKNSDGDINKKCVIQYQTDKAYLLKLINSPIKQEIWVPKTMVKLRKMEGESRAIFTKWYYDKLKKQYK
jgi:hypothetical protein